MQIDFYYWNYQCPISNETVDLLKSFHDKAEISCFDVESYPNLAIEQKMYFPFLTVINKNQRIKSPLTKTKIEKLLNGEDIDEKPYVIEFGTEVFRGELLPLTKENTHLLAGKCTLGNCVKSCSLKSDFLTGKCGEIYGYINMDKDKTVGGTEFIPSLFVPYDIPKGKEIAFLTCVYHSSIDYDYKSYPLEKLENYLKSDYTRIIAVCDETGTFPNGNLDWFLSRGYTDTGIVSVEAGYCKLHIVSKNLF